MTTWTLPFVHKSGNPALTFTLLGVVFVAFAYVAWRLFAHHLKNREARKAGVDRRHDGTHLNH